MGKNILTEMGSVISSLIYEMFLQQAATLQNIQTYSTHFSNVPVQKHNLKSVLSCF